MLFRSPFPLGYSLQLKSAPYRTPCGISIASQLSELAYPADSIAGGANEAGGAGNAAPAPDVRYGMYVAPYTV